jgi:PHP family Zn ribbon phosphoesterase
VNAPNEKLKPFKAELHIHTALSPCASVEMIPPLIIDEAISKGINLIAITDHNAIANIESVINAAEGSGVSVLPGMELQTREEIHSICLFDGIEDIQTFFNRIDHSFPEIKNNSDFFGEQFIVNKTGDFIQREERLLITSSSLSLSDAFNLVDSSGGLLIPAHINRTAYGLLPVLGMVPEDISLTCLEISKHLTIEEARIQFPMLKNYPLIQNGDAHYLEDITGFNEFLIAAPTISEIKKAMLKIEGRKHTLISHATM